MFSAYYYKLQDSWTTPLYNLPRWVAANSLSDSYESLTDSITLPSLTSFTNHSSLILAASTVIPSSWILVDSTPTSGYSLLQRFFEVFSYEKETLNPYIKSINLNQSFYWDTSDSQYVWIVKWPFINDPTIVAAELDNGAYQPIQRTQSQLDLLDTPQWRWYRYKNTLIISGIDITQQTTELRVGADDWQFIKYSELWESTNKIYLEHPATKNWIPIHPSDIRSDGLLNYNYPGICQLRCRNSRLAQSIPVFNVLVDNNILLATLDTLWNSVDIKGLWFTMYRRYGENNQTFGNTILTSNWFTEPTNTGLLNAISANLRCGEVTLISPLASGFTLPVSSTSFSIKNINPIAFITENNITMSPDVVGEFLTIYNTPDFGCALINGYYEEVTVNNNVVNVSQYINSKIIKPNINWQITYWNTIYSAGASSVIFTDNMPGNIPDMLVYFPSCVEISNGSSQVMIQSYNDTSPTLKWHVSSANFPDDKTYGLATFF